MKFGYVVAELTDGELAGHNKIYESLEEIRQTVLSEMKDVFKDDPEEDLNAILDEVQNQEFHAYENLDNRYKFAYLDTKLEIVYVELPK